MRWLGSRNCSTRNESWDSSGLLHLGENCPGGPGWVAGLGDGAADDKVAGSGGEGGGGSGDAFLVSDGCAGGANSGRDQD